MPMMAITTKSSTSVNPSRMRTLIVSPSSPLNLSRLLAFDAPCGEELRPARRAKTSLPSSDAEEAQTPKRDSCQRNDTRFGNRIRIPLENHVRSLEEPALIG